MSHAQKRDFEQPASFTFTPESMKEVDAVIAKYPKGYQASAVMPLLWIAQRQHDNWIPEKAMEEIARILDMPKIKVFEVATFYTMYNLAPVGKHHLQFCTTTPCWLRGSGEAVEACEKHLGIKLGETTPDGEFTLTDVECLGACVNAPVVQRNGDEFYEDLTPENVVQLLDDLKAGKKHPHGSQDGARHKSSGVEGATCLHEQAKSAGIKIAGEK
ncbi:MAG: NADH-quinone oxidoreductase subunit NuoE [Alphaproteobacteria bacterium]|nr:NADH-quinone oxidoreductase subunit NuoE [Alphaproteobacteria bacterium]